MVSRLSSNHLLISALAKRQRSKNPLQAGFTLVELLIVVIIIGILAAIALPGFLNQADKAKFSSAKSLSASAAKECQLWLVEGTPAFSARTVGNKDIYINSSAPTTGANIAVATSSVGSDGTLTCTSAAGGRFTAIVKSNGAWASSIVASDGGVTKDSSEGAW